MESKSNVNKICILTNAPVSQNPRVVKEADALAAAGFDVTVLYVQHALWTKSWDEEIIKRSKWKGRVIRLEDQEFYRKIIRYAIALRSHVFRLLARFTFKGFVAEVAFCRVFTEQLFMALNENAKLYIAHNPQALPVAASAARILNAQYAFDSEDLHTGEYHKNEHQSADYRLLVFLERKYLTGCVYTSAASPGIGRELADRYKIEQPLVIMNVFPLANRKLLDNRKELHKEPASRNLSLYWFSQIIGLDRGLADVVRAIALVESAELHIRGHIKDIERNKLTRLLVDTGTLSRVYLYEPLPPWKLLENIAEYDVGLSLEQPEPLNRDICVTNKLFLYLLAGIPVIATNTTGQCEILQQFPAAGFVFQSGDHVALAKIIRSLAEGPELVGRAGRAALRASETRWNWETEQQLLIKIVKRSLEK